MAFWKHGILLVGCVIVIVGCSSGHHGGSGSSNSGTMSAVAKTVEGADFKKK